MQCILHLPTGAAGKLTHREPDMNTNTEPREGKIRFAAAAWLLGLPIPIILIALLWGGCTQW